MRYESIGWCPLVGSIVNLNFDVAFDESRAKSVSRVVVRNASGEVFAFKTVVNGEVAFSFAVEVLACLQAVFMGKQNIQQQKQSFHQIAFQHTYISANLMAHNLAREAMKEDSRAYLIRRVLEQGTSEVDLRRRREPD
ncbi:hypothetical protein Gotri_001492 [Gossypium trilobum]|uniref:Uncharacterized protein n=1 Tax=Gossypium trilobum TaxID=34281 RepID=A0A7J9FEV6_9ROSI|nr:hypothetical protein [Gossypium trilobum]